MSAVVDAWVDRLKDRLAPVGEMTHWQRLAAAFELRQTDVVPVAAELDYWQIMHPGYTHKVGHYLDLSLQERLALDFYRDVAAANGCEFFCVFGGARTWGPRQLEQFANVDRVFVEKARRIFPHVFWHQCGHNLPHALQNLAAWPGLQAVQYDMPYYSHKLTWPEFLASVAKLFAGRRCAMNAPTTQLAFYGTPEEVRQMVRQFIASTRPHTTAIVMPGCEIDSYAPVEDVQAMIDAAREAA